MRKRVVVAAAAASTVAVASSSSAVVVVVAVVAVPISSTFPAAAGSSSDAAAAAAAVVASRSGPRSIRTNGAEVGDVAAVAAILRWGRFLGPSLWPGNAVAGGPVWRRLQWRERGDGVRALDVTE